VRALLLLTVFGGNVAQATIAPAIRVGGIAPDIPLIIVVLVALRRGTEVGCLTGFAAGLLQDVAGGGLVGVQGLTKATIGALIGGLSGRLAVTQPLVQVPGLVFLSVAEGVGRFGLLKLFHFPASFGELMTYVVLPQALYNGFIGAAIVLLIAWTDAARDRVA
jgi:rod shape-determining protein MreD